MKIFKHHSKNDQPKPLSNRSFKKSVNIKWNSKLFFQLGIIASLIFVYFIMELNFEVNEKKYETGGVSILDEIPMVTYTIDEPMKIPKKKIIAREQPPKIIEKVIEVVPDDTPEKEIPKVEAPSENPVEKPTAPVKKKVDPTITRSVLGVEFVPVFPGCEKYTSNLEKRNCMSSKISRFISKKFNSDKLSSSGNEKEQKITVQFTVDTKGYVTSIVARAPNKQLEKEAIRVVSRLPKMTPGKQGSVEVPVQYLIPITFKTDY